MKRLLNPYFQPLITSAIMILHSVQEVAGMKISHDIFSFLRQFSLFIYPKNCTVNCTVESGQHVKHVYNVERCSRVVNLGVVVSYSIFSSL